MSVGMLIGKMVMYAVTEPGRALIGAVREPARAVR